MGLGFGFWRTFLSVWIVASHIWGGARGKGGMRTSRGRTAGGVAAALQASRSAHRRVAGTVAEKEAVVLLRAKVVVVGHELPRGGRKGER